MFPRRFRALVSAALAFMVVACGSLDQPEASPSALVSEPQAEETMIVGVHLPVAFSHGVCCGTTADDLPFYSLQPNDSMWDDVVGGFVYSGIYRLDGTQSPVPDLAEEPCAVSENLLVVTCRLREARFHDGTPLTADDVAFTYQLLFSEGCRQVFCQTPDLDPICGAPRTSQCAAEVTALDDRTVEFRLAASDPAFITVILPTVRIEPRARVETAFAEFAEATDGADSASLEAAAAALEVAMHPADALPCEPPDDAALSDAEAEISTIGRALRSRAAFEAVSNASQPCAYGDYLVRVLSDTATALGLEGIDAIAAAYRVLDFSALPIGSGPWRVTSIDPGASMQLEAFEAFHRGMPTTERVEMRLVSTAEATEAVRDGAVDWLAQPFPADENLIAQAVGDAPSVVWARYNQLGWLGLTYNMREGQLFADPNLRQAMELCVDKEETVAAATGGLAAPIYSPISPSMWAFEPDLPRPGRDTVAGRALIEASGWTLGNDGIYRMGDRRLATTVPASDSPQALRFLELLAVQVRDCGMEITPRLLQFEDLVTTIEWPLLPPGDDQQWDAVFGGMLTTADPDPWFPFHTNELVTEENPHGWNWMGYGTEESDGLLAAARATYEQPERARLYRQFQQVLARDRPVLFAWSSLVLDPRSDRLTSTRGPLATDTST